MLRPPARSRDAGQSERRTMRCQPPLWIQTRMRHERHELACVRHDPKKPRFRRPLHPSKSYSASSASPRPMRWMLSPLDGTGPLASLELGKAVEREHQAWEPGRPSNEPRTKQCSPNVGCLILQVAEEAHHKDPTLRLRSRKLEQIDHPCFFQSLMPYAQVLALSAGSARRFGC